MSLWLTWSWSLAAAQTRRRELDTLRPQRVQLTLILMKEILSSNSTEDTVETLIVNVCPSLSPQDSDPRRIGGSGNICDTGTDEEEVVVDVRFYTFVSLRNTCDSSIEVNNSEVNTSQ